MTMDLSTTVRLIEGFADVIEAETGIKFFYLLPASWTTVHMRNSTDVVDLKSEEIENLMNE
jgi:hypothetical protein